jgi:hypothetical protein
LGFRTVFFVLVRVGLVASEFNCRSAAVSCRADWKEPVLGLLTAKRALQAPLPPQAVRGPDSRLMFHVPVGADLCRPPWQTEILMRNTRTGALETRASKEAGSFGVTHWSRTPCERPDSIRGALRAPGRQQVELDYWGSKPRFSRSYAPVSSVFASRWAVRSRFPGEAESEEPILGFFTAKVTSFGSHAHVPNHWAPQHS